MSNQLKIERGNVIENLKHVGNMSFLIQNINALIQCIHEIEPNLLVA